MVIGWTGLAGARGLQLIDREEVVQPDGRLVKRSVGWAGASEGGKMNERVECEMWRSNASARRIRGRRARQRAAGCGRGLVIGFLGKLEKASKSELKIEIARLLWRRRSAADG